MPNRWNDWLAQAERDFEHARASAAGGRHEWACFASHQAAEKAVKALHLFHRQEAWGHVVARLLAELPEPIDARHLIDPARVLDSYYIPTRDPNGHPEGAPFQHYGALQSTEALNHAEAIIAFVRAEVAER